MTGDGPLRRNAFLVAAVALPALVVVFFLVATALPRWLVDPPAYDLLVRANAPYDPGRTPVVIDVAVRDERLVATFRPVPEGVYAVRPMVFRVASTTGAVTEVPIDVPGDLDPDEIRTVAVAAVAGEPVLSQPRAPDGYLLETRRRGRAGLLGELVGIGGSRMSPVLVNGGRVIRLELPEGIGGTVTHVGWIGVQPEGR